MKKLILGLIVTSFIGSSFLSIDLFFFQVTLFKVFLLLCIIGICFQWISNANVKLIGIKNKFFSGFILFWLIIDLLGGLWAKDITNWIKYSYYIFIFLLFVTLFINYFKTIEEYETLWNTYLVVIVLLNILGWYEIFTSSYLFLDNSSTVVISAKEDRTPIAFMGNPNDFALAMLFGFFLTYMVKTNQNNLKRILCSILKISCVCLIFLTRSRSGLLGFCLGFAWILILYSKNNRKKYLFCIALLATIPIGYIVLANSSLLDFDFSMQKMNSESMRVNLIRNGLFFLKETFGLGVGGGNIEYWMQRHSIYPTGYSINMHNWWVEILVCYGISLFIVYIAFYVNLFLANYKKYKNKDYKNWQTSFLGIMGFMVAFIIGSIGGSSIFSSIWLWSCWAGIITYNDYLAKNNYKILAKNGKL